MINYLMYATEQKYEKVVNMTPKRIGFPSSANLRNKRTQMLKLGVYALRKAIFDLLNFIETVKIAYVFSLV